MYDVRIRLYAYAPSQEHLMHVCTNFFEDTRERNSRGTRVGFFVRVKAFSRTRLLKKALSLFTWKFSTSGFWHAHMQYWNAVIVQCNAAIHLNVLCTVARSCHDRECYRIYSYVYEASWCPRLVERAALITELSFCRSSWPESLNINK